MFEDKKDLFKARLQEISEIIKDLEDEEASIKESIQKIDDIEKRISENDESLKGEQTFVIDRSDVDYITNDFISHANSWIDNHEKVYHQKEYYQVQDPISMQKKYRGSIEYSINISLTPIGRLVSVCCEQCKEKHSNMSNDQYMYVEEA